MSWMVMYLKPRCEKKLAEYCRIQDMEYYLPLRMERKVYQRRKVLVEKINHTQPVGLNLTQTIPVQKH